MVKKKKKKLKIKNILLFIIIICFIIFIIILLTSKGKKKKNNIESNDNSVSTSNIESNNKDYKELISINVGDSVPTVLDYVKSSTDALTIKWDNLVDEENKVYKVGTYTGSIELEDEVINVKLEVNDTEKPIISDVKDITIYVGDDSDLFKNITITDNSHDVLSKKIIGDYNINKPGTYKLKYEVKDKALNTTTSDFILTIKDKEVVNNNNNKNVTSKGYKIEKKDGIYYINGILIANKSYSLPSSYNPGSLKPEFTIAFDKMKKDYDKIGFKSHPKLTIKSGFRSYQTQVTLYNNYVARDGKKAADRYSARAGHSEHQSGLAADFNEISDTYGETDSGKWLSNNCWKYGFILRYPKGKESSTGYMYESWHFRYLGDVSLAKTLYNNGNWLTLEEYLGIDSKYE